MTNSTLDGSLTRREFYLEIIVVWLFVLTVALGAVDRTAGWREMILPVGAFMMVALRAWSLWKATRAERRTAR